MVELWILGVGLGVSGFAGGCFMGWLAWWRINQKVDSLRNKVISGLGVDGKADKDADMASAMALALEMHQAGKPIPEIIKEVAMKYPSVAMKFAGMFMSGKIKLPAGLGEIGKFL